MNNNVTIASSTITYDVDYKGVNYSVVVNKDHNVGCTDYIVYFDGDTINDNDLADEIISFVENWFEE